MLRATFIGAASSNTAGLHKAQAFPVIRPIEVEIKLLIPYYGNIPLDRDQNIRGERNLGDMLSARPIQCHAGVARARKLDQL
jgi:hypothetical protein